MLEYSVRPERTCVVGDRLDTDMKMGCDAGAALNVLTLSGVCTFCTTSYTNLHSCTANLESTPRVCVWNFALSYFAAETPYRSRLFIRELLGCCNQIPLPPAGKHLGRCWRRCGCWACSTTHRHPDVELSYVVITLKYIVATRDYQI